MISVETHRNDYTGNGSTADYDYDFMVFNREDIRVIVNEDGVETDLVLDTDYTVSGAGESAGGSISLIDASQTWIDGSSFLLAGVSLTIVRNVDYTQETDFRNQSEFYPETHEDTFDITGMQIQQLKDSFDRAIVTQITDLPASPMELPVVADRSEKFLYFDATGLPTAESIDEFAMDAIGAALTDTSSIDLNYNDALNQISGNVIPGGVDHDALLNTHNLTTDIDHNTITNTHNLTTDIDHDSITNTHNLTTDIDASTIGASAFAAGAVPFSDGANLAVDVTNIYWDNTNKKLILGDVNAEAIAGFNLLGTVVQPRLNVNDIGLGNIPQHLVHKHSTVFPPILIGSRSNSDTSAHADVTNSMPVFNIQGYGYAGSNYKTFGQITFEVDEDGTVSNTSAPGRVALWTCPDGSTTLVMGAYVDRQQKFQAVKEVLSDGLSLSKMALVNM